MAFWYKKLGLAILILSLEIISFVLEHIGGSNRLFLVALFLLSAIGFVTTIYTSFFSSTVPAVTRSESERQLIAVDIFSSFIQLVFAYIQLIRVFLGAKSSNNNDESLLPLALAVISVVFIIRNNEKAQVFSDSASVDQIIIRNNEEAQVFSDSASVNQFIFGNNEEAQVVSDSALVNRIFLLETPAVDDESEINRESSTLRRRTTSRVNKKYKLLSLDDEVWHLKKVKKGGKFHTRLIDNNIQTVRHFKEMYKQNPNKLREILKDCKYQDWKVIVLNASCVADDENLNAYSNPLKGPTTGPLPRQFQSPHQGLFRTLKKGIEPGIPKAVKMEIERGTEGGTDRVVERVMKHLIPTLSIQSLNPRTSLDHQIKKSEEVEFKLQFADKLPNTIYTNDNIRDESDGSVQIKLTDTISRKTVKEGPSSSIEIEIVVLDGDFDFEGNENWTEMEFNDKIVHQRGYDKPLVKGKQNITLRAGVGTIDNLSFSDNSSWIKCKKLRLGARVVQSSSNIGQVRTKEAITEAFVVKDYCSKTNKKHDRPSLDDEVWHLKKVKRGGKFHTRLIDNNIQTIGNFKQLYKTNPDLLRQILNDCTDTDWEAIVHNASCVVDDHENLNAYSNPLISPTTGSGGILQNNNSNSASSSHVNVQLTLGNDNQYSGRNSAQSNELKLFPLESS